MNCLTQTLKSFKREQSHCSPIEILILVTNASTANISDYPEEFPILEYRLSIIKGVLVHVAGL